MLHWGLPGRLSQEASAWREAWRGRRDNPVLAYLQLERQRGVKRAASDPASWIMLTFVLLACAIAAYILLKLDLFLLSVSHSSATTRPLALSVLAGATRVLLGGATAVAFIVVFQRVAVLLARSSTLLAAYRRRGGGMLSEISSTTISDYEFVSATIAYAFQLTFRPLLVLVLLSTLNQLLGVLAGGTGPDTYDPAAWPGGVLWWLAGASLVIAAVKLASGLLAAIAASLLLVSFSHVWRGPAAAASLVAVVAIWLVAGVRMVWLLGIDEYLPDWDALSWALRPHWAAPLLAAGLAVLSVEAFAWEQSALYRWLERSGSLTLRAVIALGALAGLFIGVGCLFPFDDLENELTTFSSHYPVVGTWIASLSWPAEAVTFCPPLTLINLLGALDEPGAWPVCLSLAGRSLALLLIPAALCLIFLGHARSAVYAFRRWPR